MISTHDDDAQSIHASAMPEAAQISAAIKAGELWQDMSGEWHRQGRRGWHKTPLDAWREPQWAETAQPREATR